MNSCSRFVSLLLTLLALTPPASAQDDELTIRVDPPMLEMKVGEKAQLEVQYATRVRVIELI